MVWVGLRPIWTALEIALFRKPRPFFFRCPRSLSVNNRPAVCFFFFLLLVLAPISDLRVLSCPSYCVLGTIDFEEFYSWYSNKLTGTATPRHLMLADVRRKMRRYSASNVIMDTLGPALGIVVPTDFSFSRLAAESQSVWSRMTAGTVFESSKKKKVRAIFNKYDTDKSGELDMDEFEQFCIDLGESYTPEQLEVALGEIDDDGNGTIDFEEFYKWWCADPANSKDADFSNRMRNAFFGYRDTEPMEEAATETQEKRAVAGGTGDPGLVAENRRLKAELASMRAQLDALSVARSGSVALASGTNDDESSDSFEALDKGNNNASDSDSAENSQKPADATAPRKKKGKRKSRKPQKLEDSDDYETSEDQGAKVRAAKN